MARVWLVVMLPAVAGDRVSFTRSWERYHRKMVTGWLDDLRPEQLQFESGEEVVAFQLQALQSAGASGASLFMRFCDDDFQLPGIEPWGARALAASLLDARSQYSLLLDPRLEPTFPSEMNVWQGEDGEERSWQEVDLEISAGGGTGSYTAAKLGWECRRDDQAACWLTMSIRWHDFRPAFRPGIGEEEWPRICG